MRRVLQVVLALLGIVAVAAGALALLTGVALIPEAGDPGATVDSELRFFGAWYLGAGVLVLRAARRVETSGLTVRAVAVLFFAAGLGRVLSLVTVGTPHPYALVLMSVELAMPLLIPWHAAVARLAGRRP